MRKTVFDDGFQEYLTKGAFMVGEAGIPMLMDLKNTSVPKDMIPFNKAKSCKDKRKYIHFYMHDKEFSRVLTSTTKYIDLLKEFDGVITPDCSLAIGQSKCLQQANTYMNRAVGFYLQKNGIPVIPNIRWSDESSFDYCFQGVPLYGIVSISTHGCIKSRQQKEMYKIGLEAMLNTLKPTDVLVHGHMPEYIFDEYKSETHFHRYASEFERTHKKENV